MSSNIEILEGTYVRHSQKHIPHFIEIRQEQGLVRHEVFHLSFIDKPRPGDRVRLTRSGSDLFVRRLPPV